MVFVDGCLNIVVVFFAHTQGLDILHELLTNVGKIPNVSQGFYQQYLLSLMQDVFAVLTDRLHKSGFKMHATLLLQMFKLVQMNQVTVPLFDPTQFPPGTTNASFLRTHVAGLLTTSFPNLSSTAAMKFVDGALDSNTTVVSFKTQLLDFLITLKEFSAEDSSALSLQGEEQERLAKEREQAVVNERYAIPGMVKPVDIIDDDDL
jgi:exportin-1